MPWKTGPAASHARVGSDLPLTEAPDLSAAIALTAVMLGWLVFAGIFVLRRPAPAAETRRGDRKALAGVLLQGLGYAVVWSTRRRFFTPIVPVGPALDALLALLVLALVVSSLWMVWGARRALGRQWSIQARIVAGHALITQGPFRLVRHPIYTGMLGMLVATGLAVSHWTGLAAAVFVFCLGTWIRIRAEERLLRETFGSAYDRYARDVPALIPRARSVRRRRLGE